MRLVTLIATSALALTAHAQPAPPTAPPVIATSAATVPDISVFDHVGPPIFTVPPAPGEIAQLEAVDLTKLGPSLGDHLLDLASAYGRQMLVHQKNAAGYTTQAQLATDPAVKAQTERAAAAELQGAKGNLLKAVKTFKSLVDTTPPPGFTHEDDALFAYGFTLQLGKYMKEARAVYDRLLKNHPTSPHVPAAHLVFAEYHYTNAQLADAEARLRHVLKFPRSTTTYWLAMYRIGSIHMQLSRYTEALDTYFQVAMGTRGGVFGALATAARRGFVAAYVPIGKPDKAYPAFQRVDPAHAVEMLGWLTDAYTQAGDHAKAKAAHAEFARRGP
jgi:tetratricopeptide (TPR) repeat protein